MRYADEVVEECEFWQIKSSFCCLLDLLFMWLQTLYESKFDLIQIAICSGFYFSLNAGGSVSRITELPFGSYYPFYNNLKVEHKIFVVF